MGGLALLARELGFTVSGSDANVYPPMSDQLSQAGIELIEGYAANQITKKHDVYIIGNTLSRGNPCVEAVLDEGLAYTSGPQWLAEHVLRGKHVLAVSGTHGKTTTTSMLAWLLESAGKDPGFLIGGVAENFGLSARLGDSDYFAIEADEYDTAFFDKRSKFIHYRPHTLVINNIEFDHADIFDDIEDIKKQFHNLIRILPSAGKIIIRDGDEIVQQVLKMGYWSKLESFGIESGSWGVQALEADYSKFNVMHNGEDIGAVSWDLIGQHNAENGIAAIASACDIGVDPADSCQALNEFLSVKRRLEQLACINGITVYDDFAHHPTAIKTTLKALRAKVRQMRIITVLEPRSNTMKMGVHKETLADSLDDSDKVFLFQSPDVNWDLNTINQPLNGRSCVYTTTDELLNDLQDELKKGDHVVIMSNGGFENIHQRLISRLGNG